MKRILLLLSLCIFLAGCVACSGCIQFPKRITDEKGRAVVSESCYRYEICMYYVAIGKLQSNCNLELDQCRKDTIYTDCGKEETRWKGQREQDCWNIKD
jgi:hypothetical protein